MPRVYKITPLYLRFWEKVNRFDDNSCWEWLGYKNKKGYGQISKDETRKLILAHRASWLLHNGSFDESLYVCHKCDNPSCVNPKHLFLGTNKDNMEDRDRKGRTKPGYVFGSKCGASKLKEYQVCDIRNSNLSAKELAVKYNINISTVRQILKRKTWRHI